MSKVVRPASAWRSMASTAASRSMRPHAPLVCHIPFRTRQITSESAPPPPLRSVATRGALSVSSAARAHRTAGLRALCGRRLWRLLVLDAEPTAAQSPRRGRQAWAAEADISVRDGRLGECSRVYAKWFFASAAFNNNSSLITSIYYAGVLGM
uniref:Uncharacterized protein n=1 Tax=Ananas comosus var. bracteatus TaxID=296719 RepID=A0A6V7Q5N0_ANACO|nr:unnamed protein product [Ananas comosus var. bracteatus]